MITVERQPRHPGRILSLYYLRPRGISVTGFAAAAGLTRKHVSRIVNGHADVTAETAERFARVLGTSAQFWMNLQTAVDLHRARRRLDAGEGKSVVRGAFAVLADEAPV